MFSSYCYFRSSWLCTMQFYERPASVFTVSRGHWQAAVRSPWSYLRESPAVSATPYRTCAPDPSLVPCPLNMLQGLDVFLVVMHQSKWPLSQRQGWWLYPEVVDPSSMCAALISGLWVTTTHGASGKCTDCIKSAGTVWVFTKASIPTVSGCCCCCHHVVLVYIIFHFIFSFLSFLILKETWCCFSIFRFYVIFGVINARKNWCMKHKVDFF